MLKSCRITTSFGLLLLFSALYLSLNLASAQTGSAVVFRVQAGPAITAPVSGRLLVFLKQGHGDKEVNSEEFHPESTYVAAREIRYLAPGTAVEIDADELAFPAPFNSLSAGDYEVQAVLDVDHDYNYSGRDADDWISAVTPLPNWKPGSPEPVLTLDKHPEPEATSKPTPAPSPSDAVLESVPSKLLSQFWGHEVAIQAWVILPPGYSASGSKRYSTAYWTHGFGGNLRYNLREGLALHKRMVDGTMPPMFWVMLDESIPQGTHEFADSVNNGPWGAALTTEFIPALEAKYRMDAKPSGRLLNGHSSGGWATLQLEVNYPGVFGGTWSTSPDPSDFHDFTGSDLYAPHANVYHGVDGKPTPIMRDKGKVLATFEQFARLEDVLGPYGGQVSSFDWVFSPKGTDGAPEPMFDRITGDVHPEVVAYWHDHYDLAHIVETRWAGNGPLLKGRIHLFVGTADTFYLDGAAHKFEARLQALGAEPHFTYLPDRTHFNLYQVDKDQLGLFDQIAAEMYAVARPGTPWKSTPVLKP
jgi:enterochelin esterase-like enzyme